MSLKQEIAIATMEENPQLLTASLPTSSSLKSLIHMKVEDIITICMLTFQNDLHVVMARRDMAFQELKEEREWIWILEKTLSDNKIPLPKYPFKCVA